MKSRAKALFLTIYKQEKKLIKGKKYTHTQIS